ncbi:MAG: hypothetical protein KDA24_17345 [Deltaproteobacteria bacterium]|nr:hypothetical protein [Deltaproteobacteria bacterium]
MYPIQRTAPVFLVTASLLLGCPSGEPAPPTPEEHPCAEVWGETPASGRVHVSPSGDADGDGTLDSPFSTVDAGLEATRAGTIRQIALDAGTLSGTYLLHSDFGDTGLQLVGCGSAETFLDATGSGSPAIEVGGADTADVLIRDLALVGGRRSFQVSGGAGMLGPIVMQGVDVLDSVRVGVLIDGFATRVDLYDVLVQDIGNEGGNYGWGISIQTGRQLSAAFEYPVVLRQVTVEGAEGIGILVDGAWVDFEDVTVAGTASSGQVLGRGLQLQNWSMGYITGLRSEENSDAAVFLEKPGRPDLDAPDGPPVAVELFDSFLGPTSGASIPGEPSSAADGLTATQIDDGGGLYGAETFRVVLDGTDLGGNERAHALIEAITMQVGSNNVFGKGAAWPIAVQGDGFVEAIGGGAPAQAVSELVAGDALGINRALLSLDDVVAD